ncbi:MAG: dienelactone hydrolase family protein [Rhodospirillales bacterium]|nr:dienelactone hydrolase family protein [Rhodospirillales bacterium]
MPKTLADSLRLAANDNHAFASYRSRQAVGEPRAGLVLLQEIFGVNRHIRAAADRFAESGLLVLAPALFDRIEPGMELTYESESVARGRILKAKVPYDRATEDLAACVQWLQGQNLKVGVIGFCWGGDLAFLAARLPGVAASVAFYGGSIGSLAGDNPPKAPLQMHFGLEDQAIPQAVREQAYAGAPDAEVFEYPAGHGFCCDERPGYRQDAAEAGWERARAFFARHLGA